MELTIETVHDLVRIINSYPQWRQQIRETLFPEIDLPKAFQELAEAQRRTEQTVRELSQEQRRTKQELRELSQTVRELSLEVHELVQAQRRTEQIVQEHTAHLARLDAKQDEMKRNQDEMKRNQDEMKRNQDEMKGDIEALKRGQDKLRRGQDKLSRNQDELRGQSYEQSMRARADAIFGYFLRRGRKRRNEVADYLDEAYDEGQISSEEHEQVLASDLLWAGKLKRTKEELFLVVEVSWKAEQNDLERAYARANILRSIGLKALGVVAGMNWESGLHDQALDKGVIIVKNLRLNKESWVAAASKAGL